MPYRVDAKLVEKCASTHLTASTLQSLSHDDKMLTISTDTDTLDHLKKKITPELTPELTLDLTPEITPNYFNSYSWPAHSVQLFTRLKPN